MRPWQAIGCWEQILGPICVRVSSLVWLVKVRVIMINFAFFFCFCFFQGCLRPKTSQNVTHIFILVDERHATQKLCPVFVPLDFSLFIRLEKYGQGYNMAFFWLGNFFLRGVRKGYRGENTNVHSMDWDNFLELFSCTWPHKVGVVQVPLFRVNQS